MCQAIHWNVRFKETSGTISSLSTSNGRRPSGIEWLHSMKSISTTPQSVRLSIVIIMRTSMTPFRGNNKMPLLPPLQRVHLRLLSLSFACSALPLVRKLFEDFAKYKNRGGRLAIVAVVCLPIATTRERHDGNKSTPFGVFYNRNCALNQIKFIVMQSLRRLVHGSDRTTDTVSHINLNPFNRCKCDCAFAWSDRQPYGH